MIIADQTIVMIFRLVICTIVRTEEKLNVVSKMKCVKQIGLQLMTRLESISQDPNIHIRVAQIKKVIVLMTYFLLSDH